jgi:curved DNA-binding protein
MEFKDYYATLGVERSATQDEVKRAYRKLARKYHPDVSKEPDAEARFKEVAEAHEALIDADRRAAYDELAQRHANGQSFEMPPGWDAGPDFRDAGGAGRAGHPGTDFSDFFESLFGRASGEAGRRHGARGGPVQGGDLHAKVVIDLIDAYAGARRTVSLRMPMADARGQVALQDRQLEVSVPIGVRPGQHLRLAGQGAMGRGGGPPGDLYLEIRFAPHALFRVEERDIHFDLPVAPWEAALGATVSAPTPQGPVQLNIPPGSSPGRRLRLKGRGLPGQQGQGDQPVQRSGDLYATLVIALPPADSAPATLAYTALASAFAGFDPRSGMEAGKP